MIQPVKLVTTLSLVADNEFAFVRYMNPPDGESHWFLPNDVLHDKEAPYDGVRRIARTQIGMDVTQTYLFDVDSFIGNDGSWHLALHFYTDIADKAAVKIGQMVTDVSWHPAIHLPPQDQVAHHGWFNGIAQRADRHRRRKTGPATEPKSA